MVNCSPFYDGQPYSFSRPGIISLPGREKGGIVGTLGPSPAPSASRPDPRASRGLCRGLAGLDTSQPRSARPILRPDARESHSPDALFSSSTYLPDRRLSQAKLPTGSPLYRRKSTLELTPRLGQNRNILLVAVRLGR